MGPRLCSWLSGPTQQVPGATTMLRFYGFWLQPTPKPASTPRLKRRPNTRWKLQTFKATRLWPTHCRVSLLFMTWVCRIISERDRIAFEDVLRFILEARCARGNELFLLPICLQA